MAIEALHPFEGLEGADRFHGGDLALGSVDHDRANGLAGVHQIEALVDVIEAEGVGNQIVDIDLPLHVPVDNLGHVGAAPGAAEGRTLPDPTGNQLEGAGRDLLAGTGNADDDRDTPALVTALQGLAHGVDPADAFEGVVGAALGEFDQVAHQVVAHLLGVDEVGHTKGFAHGLFRRIEIDPNDHVGADHLGAPG